MSPEIVKPTILLNIEQAVRNINRMSEKARRQGIRFRPHFKTHQSAVIGEWFRQVGVTAITVSSVDMALYFSRCGWDDITIAFPVNLRQASVMNELAQSTHLGLLVESVDTVKILSTLLANPVDIWIEIDDGSNRSGVRWDRPEEVLPLAAAVQANSRFRMRGLLTHAGRIYHAGSPAEIQRIFYETVERMNMLRVFMSEKGFALDISVGDTPGCTLCEDLGVVDEIRPGNFVLYDAMQMAMGVCAIQDIAAVMACPVVAKYPVRGEVVIYGGAVHFSKDTFDVNGQNVYGMVVNMEEINNPDQSWITPVEGGYLTRLSQEHGVASLPESSLQRVKSGDLLYIIPAHVCLTVSAMGEYRTQVGTIITTLTP
jgi:D-serine deaminase-like pyridoxal phosphate-dependent protein